MLLQKILATISLFEISTNLWRALQWVSVYLLLLSTVFSIPMVVIVALGLLTTVALGTNYKYLRNVAKSQKLLFAWYACLGTGISTVIIGQIVFLAAEARFTAFRQGRASSDGYAAELLRFEAEGTWTMFAGLLVLLGAAFLSTRFRNGPKVAAQEATSTPLVKLTPFAVSAAQATTGVTASGESLIRRIQELDALKNANLISRQEYATQRKRILDQV